ncbi:invasion associated locus B family protein [Celeribacter sp.]|uniref:invasion associated locus B family protein n=1 Tax=Celeribacter sp. TaxID=1890673 RepID=UPI003A94FCB7
MAFKSQTALTLARIAGLAALLAGTALAPTFAQDATSEAATTEDAAPAAPADAAAPAATEDAAVEDSNIGKTYTAETHGDWEIRCVKMPEGQKDPCTMYQLLIDDQGNQVSEITLFQLPEGQQAVAGGTMVAPLETALQPGIGLAVDSGQGKRYPFAFCNQIGCFSRVGFTAEEVAAFKAGAKVKVTLVPIAAPEGKMVEVTASLKGFTAAYDAVARINAAE